MVGPLILNSSKYIDLFVVGGGSSGDWDFYWCDVGWMREVSN